MQRSQHIRQAGIRRLDVAASAVLCGRGDVHRRSGSDGNKDFELRRKSGSKLLGPARYCYFFASLCMAVPKAAEKSRYR